METILILFVILITLIIFLGTFYALWIGYEQWQYMSDPHKMLFLSSTNNEINQKLDKIIAKYAKETNDYNLVELGCGKGVVLKYLAQKYPWKSVTGIEGQKSVWLQAWINCKFLPLLNLKKLTKKQPLSRGVKISDFGVFSETPINLLNQNIFDYKSQKPTFHYCYLGVKLMKEIYDKGLFADSVVVSLDYEIEGVEPTEIIQLETKGKIQNQLLVYIV
jgi:Putative methyltransferase